MKKLTKLLVATAIGAAFMSSATQATVVEVQVSNLFAEGGLALTPVWVGFHDGSFDTFNLGDTSSSSLQALAENGDISGIRGDFAAANAGVDGAVFGPAGFPGAPVIEPGEVTSAMFDIDAATMGNFSFLSMLIPTNDAFIGNDAADAYSLFDALGNFIGLDILVLGSNVWDSGTELNRGFGSPFLVGAGAEERQDENGVIAAHTGLDVLAGGLAIIGGSTPAGFTIDALAADFTAQGFQVARITVSEVAEVSTPALSGLFLLGLAGMATRRKLKK